MTNHRERTISFTLPLKAKPVPAARIRVGRLPRITRLMALALRFEDLLENRTVRDYSDLARLGEVSRARITQIMNLLNLAPDIQERLLFLEPVTAWRDPINERAFRAVSDEPCWEKQRKVLAALLPRRAE